MWRFPLNVANLRMLPIPNSEVWIASLSFLREDGDVNFLESLGFGELFEKFRKGRIVGFLTCIASLGGGGYFLDVRVNHSLFYPMLD
jgi:hypothetical protein